eukprot:gb/GFBE01002167.1/.p1 GENE.gb/GFBE01002167.1/~~gb/GFBE01002167.1/.p1  ORF type:complete len:176 (+),score=30.46 gb/GFBE01002167.1/:1-528(+)
MYEMNSPVQEWSYGGSNDLRLLWPAPVVFDDSFLPLTDNQEEATPAFYPAAPSFYPVKEGPWKANDFVEPPPPPHPARDKSGHNKIREKLTSEPPSRGSKNHHKGQCRPCKMYHSDEGCAMGQKCNFCHYTHDKETTLTEVPAVLHKVGQLFPTRPGSVVSSLPAETDVVAWLSL